VGLAVTPVTLDRKQRQPLLRVSIRLIITMIMRKGTNIKSGYKSFRDIHLYATNYHVNPLSLQNPIKNIIGAPE